jgi:transposase
MNRRLTTKTGHAIYALRKTIVEPVFGQIKQAHGFATALWTLPRIAAVIERTTGVHYHPGHVWKILAALEWSLQRPARRARERNDEGRRLWRSKRGPAIKKTPGGEEPEFSSRTKAASHTGRR